MLKGTGEATLPTPSRGRKTSEIYDEEGEYKEMGYQQTLMYGRYSRWERYLF